VRRLLIVTYHFPPSAASGGFRMLGFARHLPKHGWDVSVVAPPSMPWEAVDRGLEEQIPLETATFRPPFPDNRILRKFVGQPAWLPRAARACAAALRAHPADAVLTSGPPHCVHTLGLYLKRRYGLPWAADFRDPWIANSYDPGDGRGVWGQLAARVERAVLRSADTVVANAPLAAELLRGAYPEQRSKIVSITNGYDEENFAGRSVSTSEEFTDDVIDIVHTGSLYMGRDPRPLLDAISDLGTDTGPGQEPFRLCLYGMNEDSKLATEIEHRGLGATVQIIGQVPYFHALQAMMRARILLLLDTPGRRIGVPAKLYEYIGAGRPILALGERGGDLEWVLDESGVSHRIVPPDDRDGIGQALVELASGPSTEGGAAAEYRLRFSRERIAGDLAVVLDAICGPTGAISGRPPQAAAHPSAGSRNR